MIYIRKFKEKYINSARGYTGDIIDIYKNPTPKDISLIHEKTDRVGLIIDFKNKDIYAFNALLSHKQAAILIGLRDIYKANSLFPCEAIRENWKWVIQNSSRLIPEADTDYLKYLNEIDKIWLKKYGINYNFIKRQIHRLLSIREFIHSSLTAKEYLEKLSIRKKAIKNSPNFFNG